MGDIIKNYYDNSQSHDIEIKTPMSIDKILELREENLRRRMAVDAEVVEECTVKPVNEDKEETSLPTELSTGEALSALRKLKDVNLLTADFKPSPELSLTEKVLLAGMISQHLFGGKNQWKTFQSFWGINNMSSLYSQAMQQHKSHDFIGNISKALK